MNKEKKTNGCFIEDLIWDSSFFNLKIGKSIISDKNIVDISSLLSIAKKDHYSLIYLFTDYNINIKNSILNNLNGRKVDTKITYCLKLKTTNHLETKNNSIEFFNDSHSKEVLYNLAFESGQHSRFKIDKNFSLDTFQSLYKKWIDNSINGIFADYVFTYKDNNNIAGFITLKTKNKDAHIGLIAASDLYRNKGIGTALIGHAKQIAYRDHCKHLIVATQLQNVGACKFYEKNGFEIIKKENIYHFWL